MYREQVVFKCPFTSSTFRSKSFTAIELEDGLSCYQFLGMPQPTLSKRRLMRQQPDMAKVDIKLREPTESRRLPLIPVVTLQSANEYGVVEENPKCTGKRARPGTPSSPALGGQYACLMKTVTNWRLMVRPEKSKVQFYSFTV
jgi:hypothetical protein